MLLKLFKSNNPSVIFLIPLVGVILWIPALFNIPIHHQTASVENTTFVFNWLFKLMSFHPKASVILALIIVIIEAYMLIGLNLKYIFIENKTYLPSLLFVIFASIFSSYQMLHPLLIANFFILLAIEKTFIFEKSTNKLKRYFEGGFLLGLGTLIYPNIFVFIVVIWLTQIILRAFNWREWLTSILGLITPFVFYLAILFLRGGMDGLFQKLGLLVFSPIEKLQFSFYSAVAVGFIVLIIVLSMLIGFQAVSAKKISTRKYFSLFFWFTLYVIALFFTHPSFGLELTVTLAIPLSMICSVFFIEIRSKWISEVIFALTILSIFVIIWFQ